LGAVVAVVGAVQREVAQGGELGLDAVEPAAVGRGVGDLDVARRGPVPDPAIDPGRQVGAEVVTDDRDSYFGRVEAAQVAAERQERGAVLRDFHMPVEPVPVQVIGGEEMAYSLGAPVGRAHPQPRTPLRILLRPSDSGPHPSRAGLEVQRPELVHAEDHGRFVGVGGDLPVGDRVEVLDPGLLRFVLRIGAGLPGLQALKRDALLAEQDP